MTDDTNIVRGHFLTKLDVPVEFVLEGAMTAGLRSVVVIGIDASGELYVASSQGAAEANWLMDLAKHYLVSEAI